MKLIYSYYKISESHPLLTCLFPNHEVDLVYEAGCCGFSAARCFLNLGWNVLVVNPSDIKTGDKQRYQKTDALDSRNLSNQLKSGGSAGNLYSYRRPRTGYDFGSAQVPDYKEAPPKQAS